MDDDKEAVGGGVWKSGEAEMVRGGLFLFSNTEGRQETKSLECQHFRSFSAYEVVDIDQQKHRSRSHKGFKLFRTALFEPWTA